MKYTIKLLIMCECVLQVFEVDAQENLALRGFRFDTPHSCSDDFVRTLCDGLRGGMIG